MIQMLLSLLSILEIFELPELSEEIDVELLAARFKIVFKLIPHLEFQRVCVTSLVHEDAQIEFHRRRQLLVLLLQSQEVIK